MAPRRGDAPLEEQGPGGVEDEDMPRRLDPEAKGQPPSPVAPPPEPGQGQALGRRGFRLAPFLGIDLGPIEDGVGGEPIARRRRDRGELVQAALYSMQGRIGGSGAPYFAMRRLMRKCIYRLRLCRQ